MPCWKSTRRENDVAEPFKGLNRRDIRPQHRESATSHDQLLIGSQRQYRHGRSGRGDQTVAAAVFILLRIEPEAEKLQPLAASRAQRRGILADAPREGDRVESAHR